MHDSHDPEKLAKENTPQSADPSCTTAETASIRPGDVFRGTLSEGLPQRLDINFEDLGRGDVYLEVELEECPLRDGLGLAMCICKHGRIPDMRAQGRHWTSGLACPTQEDMATGWQCRIQAHRWIYATEEASVFIVLDTQPPVPPVRPPDMFHADSTVRNACLSLIKTNGTCTPAVGDRASFSARLNFVSEASRLSDELRMAHEDFHNAFKGMNCLELHDAGVETLGREGDLQLTFGLVHFVPFIEVLRRVAQPKPHELFVDLGSGAGHAVFAAALAFPELRGCIGYELVPTLHDAAKRVQSSLNCPMAAVDFHEGDFMADGVDWTDADIVWIHSLAFNKEMCSRIARKALRLKPGTRILTMQEDFAAGIEGFESLHDNSGEKIYCECGYGDSEIYVLRRVTGVNADCP